MKYLSKILFTIFAVTFLLTACKKEGALPFYKSGNAITLTTSKSTVAATPTDADTSVLKLNWSSPDYSNDTATTKYTIEIDSTGRNFAKAVIIAVTGARAKVFTGKELNNILLGFGFKFNVAYDIDIRVTSSYANNNDIKVSNTIKISAAPYKVPPKIAVPAQLYIVGALNGWNNSASLDTKYKFSLVDETTYEGIFQFNSGDNFKLIQDLGNWGTQFHMIAGGTTTYGSFEQKDADPAFNVGSTAGWYRVIVDFQNATYKIEPAPQRVVTPTELYMIGSLNSWNNTSTIDPKYKFTKTGDFVYTLNINFDGTGGNFKLIQTLGNWSTQFHKVSGNAAYAEIEQKDSDPAFDLPTVAGNYKVKVDFATNKYWAVKQ